jgi:hypothetical protein
MIAKQIQSLKQQYSRGKIEALPDHIKPKLKSREIKKIGALRKEKILKLQKAEAAKAKAASRRQRGNGVNVWKYYKAASQPAKQQQHTMTSGHLQMTVIELTRLPKQFLSKHIGKQSKQMNSCLSYEMSCHIITSFSTATLREKPYKRTKASGAGVSHLIDEEKMRSDQGASMRKWKQTEIIYR